MTQRRAAGREHHRVHSRVLLMWWWGINETVLSDRNQWARLFGGLFESIILLSCCLVALQQREGQREGRHKNVRAELLLIEG